ncbi:MAG: recombinase family protein [Dysosmobacter welbionis]
MILLAFCRYRYHTSLFDRPDFQRLLADIEEGKVRTVITKDLSRLGRNQLHTGLYIEERFPCSASAISPSTTMWIQTAARATT